MSLKRTALFDTILTYKPTLVDFAGWEMPIQFEGIVKEHNHVRNSVGIFDVSHMGEIDIVGPMALDFCQKVSCNDVSRLKPGQVQYNVILNEEGGIIDDCTLYKFHDDHFMFVVNASRKENVLNWLYLHQTEGVEVKDQSDHLGLIAVQGPKAPSIVSDLISRDVQTIRYYEFQVCQVQDLTVIVSRTGYTGEDGFEIYVPNEQIKSVWDQLMELGQPLGITPIGLGARDTLRLEMGYRLYGNDMDEQTTPLEAGISWAVDFNKGSFIGAEALKAQKQKGGYARVRAIALQERGIPRPGCPVWEGDQEIGTVVSGTFSPTLKKGIGLAKITTQSKVGASVRVDIRGRMAAATIVRTPFVKGSVKK